ncbi:MAG: TIGR03936 family radical SAM-associated protein [Gemmataceae bacterium]|nr:TIGR03936 family radical SAM-associated protein [Gemmataceae bacterium]
MALGSHLEAPPPPASPPRPTHRYRLRFRKAGNLRLVSHIDLMHVFERMLRRALLPFASTQGFHPKPCLVFAQALALGVAGLNEVVDLDLLEAVPADDVLTRLNQQAPPGLEFLDVRSVDGRRAPQVRRAFYRLPLVEPIAGLAERCAILLARQRCVVERLRPRRRCLDIRPFIADVQAGAQADGAALTMALWITPNGAARPEEIVHALGLGALLDQGAVLERTHLELMDELPADERWLPDIPRLADVEAAPEEIVAAAGAAPEPPVAIGQPLIETPLSFET